MFWGKFLTTKTKFPSWRYACIAAGVTLLVFAAAPASAEPNYCILNNPFPTAPVDPWSSHPGIAGNPYFGSSRAGNSRAHQGLDFHMPMDTHVPIQSGSPVSGGEAQFCNIIGNESGPIQNVSGYGLSMFFDCGNGIKVMYAHLNGYNASTKTAINGDTGNARGTAPHVHYEVILDGQKVDPMCVLGLAPPSSYQPNARSAGPCDSRLPAGPANLCDSNIRNILKQDAQKKGGKGGADPGGTTYKPTDHENGVYGNPDPKYDIPYPGGSGPDFEGEGDYNINSVEGTYRFTGNSDEDVGEKGGETTSGTAGGEAHIPPLGDSQGEPDSSCAVDTWVALANRAALEARRETMMNKRFIAKADSVLDYGCLPYYLEKTQNELAGIFSETDRWANMEVDLYGAKHTIKKTLGAQSMDSALMKVVWAAHEKYKTNFNHALMGGLENYAEKPAPDQCKDMQKVWLAAQCQEFPGQNDIFLKFSELVGKDARTFPAEMACKNSGITQPMIDAAAGKVQKYDKPVPRFDYLSPPEDKAGCKAPIPTGVTVYVIERRDDKSPEFITDNLIENAKARGYGYITKKELEERFKSPDGPKILDFSMFGIDPGVTISDEQMQEIIAKIEQAGITVHDGEGHENLPPLSNETFFHSEIKSYDDAVCSNAGCNYINENRSGMGQCVQASGGEQKS